MIRPKAMKVTVLENYCLEILFDNGERKIFDVKPYFESEWYQELKKREIFEQVQLTGLSISWPGGQDICPDELYEHSRLV